MSEPTGTVTFLLTDIEGSTVLWERSPAGMESAISLHDSLAAESIAEYGGALIKSRGEGDSLFGVFPRAGMALAAARQLQERFQNDLLIADSPIRVRMAIHTGEAVLRDGDYFGTAVNRCARLRSIAHGGQILLSLSTQQLARDSLPEGITLKDLGTHRLKDLQQPERVFQLLHPALRSDFPAVRSLDSYQHNLPRQTSSFVGREKEIERVEELIGKTCMLTLTGEGGSGKTRLALQVGAEVVDHYPDGVWLVELASLSDPDLVPQAVGSVFGIRPESGLDVQQALLESLRTKRLLILLDNCEHLIAPSARIADSILRACPEVRILATSREALRIPGETTWRVPPLESPDPAKLPSVRRVAQFESVHLFLERASAALPGFEMTTREQAGSIASICSQLDGIPLAIELAAPWVTTLGLGQIAERLGSLLTIDSPTAPTRQRTLDAAIGWSYDLLTENERTLLRRLSVFAGGWALGAAEAICAGDGLDDAAVLPALRRLVDTCLVATSSGVGGETRYRLLETIRKYAQDRVSDSEPLRERHRDHYLALSEDASKRLDQADQKLWFDRLDEEHDNLRAALAWSVEGDARLRMAVALHRFWEVRGYLQEGRGWLEGALTRTESAPEDLRARAHNAAGVLAWYHGDRSVARVQYEAALDVYRSLSDQMGMALALTNLGILTSENADYDLARSRYEAALEIFRTFGNRNKEAAVLSNLGVIAYHEADYVEAECLFLQSLDLCASLGDPRQEAELISNLAGVAYRRGDSDMARRRYLSSLCSWVDLKDWHAVTYSLTGLALQEMRDGDGTRGVWMMAVASHSRDVLHTPLTGQEQAEYDEALDAARLSLGEAEFRAAWDEGTGTTLESALRELEVIGVDRSLD